LFDPANPEGDLTTDTEQRLLVPINDSCEKLGGISRPTLYGLVNTGELDLVKIGTRSFITAESLRDFVDRRLREATADLDEPAKDKAGR
jgi:predicted DNA-binding transcriptional regulator AlpA